MSKKMLLEDLEEALILTKELNSIVTKIFPDIEPTKILDNLTTDEKIALGDQNISDLENMILELQRRKARKTK